MSISGCTATRNTITLAIAFSWSLSACMTASPMGGTSPTEDRCNAELAKSAMGREASTQVVEQARVDARAHVARVLRPGQVVTMEFRAGRLNVDVDERNTVTGLRCG